MGKRIIFLFLGIIIFSALVSAGFGYDSRTITQVTTKSYNTNNTYVTQNITNGTAFNGTYHNTTEQWNANFTLLFSSYNNASYLSIFNSTYDGFIAFNLTNFRNNLTDIDCVGGQSVVGVQPNGTVLCASGGSGVTSVTRGFGFNETGTSITSTGQMDVNRTIFDLLYSSITYNQTTPAIQYCDGQIGLNESRFISTANTTLDNLVNQNTTWNSLFIGSVNNASYLSTANSTLNNLMVQNSTWNSLFIGSVNNVSYLSTFNASYMLKTGGLFTGQVGINNSNLQYWGNITNNGSIYYDNANLRLVIKVT